MLTDNYNIFIIDLQKSVSDLQNTSALMKTELSVIKKSLENSVGNPKGDDDDYQSLLPREASSSENYEKTVNSPLTMSARNQQYLKSLTTQQVTSTNIIMAVQLYFCGTIVSVYTIICLDLAYSTVFDGCVHIHTHPCGVQYTQ